MTKKVENKKFKVEKIVWYSKETKWGVLAASPVDDLGSSLTSELMNKYGNVSITGNFEGVYEGAGIEVIGEVIDGKYGKQIQLKVLKVLHDTSSKEGIVNFLSRSVIKGISTQNALKIYEAFGDKAIEITINKPEVLININGIGKRTVEKITNSVGQYKRMEPLIKFCSKLGLPYSLILKLDEELGDVALSVIQEDPFKILEISPNISFKQVDNIYIKSGGNPKSVKRLDIALLYTLKNLALLEGSTGCKSITLKNRFYKLLDLDGENSEYESTVFRLYEQDKVVISEDAITGLETGIVYYKHFLEIEKSISEKIKALNTYGIKAHEIKEEVIEEEIKDFPFSLNAQQVAAIRKSLESNVSLLSGPAGCVDCDTEYFNGHDWVPISQYEEGDKVLQYNTDGTVELVIPEEHIIATSSLLFRMQNSRGTIDQVLSDNHRFVYFKNREVDPTILEFREVMEKYHKEGKIEGYIKTGNNSFQYMGSDVEIFPYTPKDGKQYCFTVPSGMLVLRRNGNVFVTGNSGKSSITKAVARIYARSGYQVVLTCPTAKACRRLEECVGLPAQTIHRFLGMTSDGTVRNNGDSYDNMVIFVDEASMLDILLFNSLLAGAHLTTRIVLIGDNNQLPSVQAGNVLGDLVDSENMNVSLLTDVMRQQEDSHIIKYCTMINEGKIMDPCEHEDFHYEEFGEGEELKEFFYEKYVEEVKKYGLNEVQVIAPYKKGELGMDNLNSFIQCRYNESGESIMAPYKLGDKVRHTMNNYKKDVFNGETGTIISYDPAEEEMKVDYGNKIVCYDGTDVDEITLSYVSTVHSSQGSEYKVVFVILDDDSANDFLHIRRLLYTAVSRGKKKVYILSKPYLVDKCISNGSFRPRITKLKEYMMKE